MAVISAGGFSGSGSRYVAVPLSELQSAQNDHCTLPRAACTLPRAAKEYLMTLPPVSDGTTPTRG